MDSTTESTGSKTITNQAQPPASSTETVTNVMIGSNPKRQQSQHQSQASVPKTNEDAESNQQLSLNKPINGDADIQAPGSSPPDFDFNLPCRFFKSTFARSLSLSNSNSGAFTVNQSKSMDFINANRSCAQLAPATSSVVPNRKCSTDSGPINGGSSAKNYEILPTTPGGGEGATVPPIPARRQNIETSAIIPTASAVNGAQHLLRNGCGMTTNRVTAGNGNGSIISATCRLAHVANAGNSHFVRRNVCWPPTTSTSSSGEQECQLVDETDHEMKNSTGEYTDNNRFEVVDPSTNVEAVILQNQVDTLQWQLKQAETSCGMYRAVMEEVARFLDRYQRNSAYNRSDQISRSKSMHHVYEIHDKGSDSGNSSAYLRARSSTNLIDPKRMSPHSCGAESTKSGGEDHYDLTSPINSYNTFKDFTWRRSPKKRGDPKLSPSDEAEDKLNKEAFRLSRTIHNLLHTQQPDLTQHRHSLGQRIKSIPNGNILPDATAHQKANLTAEMLFLRTMNMRDSRLSLRSSTDSSVHSTSSSSKVETDEENYSPPLHSKQCSTLCSTTEDESGFSSISSFQEIGVPLSSTMISSSTSSSHLDDTIEQGDFNLDSRNSTLKAVMHASSALNSNVGVPVANDTNRWDSKTYRKNKFQRFSTLSNEDSTTVLWV